MVDQNPFVDPMPLPIVGAATAVVLVGIDGSETSWDALSWACGEARRLRGRAVAVFVSSSADSTIAVTALVGAFPFDCGWNEAAAIERAETLRREVECYAAGHGVDLIFVHTHGDTASELLRLATVHHADQIVVGRSMKARHNLAGSLGCQGLTLASVWLLYPLAGGQRALPIPHPVVSGARSMRNRQRSKERHAGVRLVVAGGWGGRGGAGRSPRPRGDRESCDTTLRDERCGWPGQAAAVVVRLTPPDLSMRSTRTRFVGVLEGVLPTPHCLIRRATCSEICAGRVYICDVNVKIPKTRISARIYMCGELLLDLWLVTGSIPAPEPLTS